MQYYLGFDVGSTKTHALIVNETGQCLGFGKAWGGNHQAVGFDGLSASLQDTFTEAAHMAGITADQVSGAGFGISGYDFPSDREPHLQQIARLGLSCPMELVNDGVNGLLAGTTCGIGVNLTAGSGVNCCGRGPDGREGRIVGNGYSFGEYGGGGEIVWKGLHLVNYAWIKRIPPTALTRIYLDATGAKDELALMEGLSNGQYHLLPYIVPQIFTAARAGDAAANELLHFSGEELGWLAVSVIRQIGMEDDEVEVVMSGSIFLGGDLICRPMEQVLFSQVPHARLIHLDSLPVVGPVVLGIQAAGRDGFLVREVIKQSLGELLK